MKYKNVTLVQLNNERSIKERSLHAGYNIWDALGIQRIGAVLEENKYDVTLIQQFEQPNDEIYKRVIETNPEVIGLSTWTCTWPSNLELAKRIKEHDKKLLIIAGGYHVSSEPISVLEKNIDYGVVGEGEISFLKLLNHLNEERDISSLDGLILKDGGSIKINPTKRIRDLDALPDPLRNPEILKYTKVRMLMDPPVSKQKGVVMIDYSRGCVFACKYCDSNLVWGPRVAWRSPKRVINELKNLKEKYGTNTAYFTDLTFNLNREKTAELCDLLVRENLGIKFYVTVRLAKPNGQEVKLLVDYGLLKTMKDAGVQKLGWGVETFSEDVKKDFRKNVNLNNIKTVFDHSNELGLFNRCFLMLGHKEESRETIDYTIKCLKYLTPDELRLSYLTPFHGTPLWDEIRQEDRLLTEDLTRYTTNEPVIKSKLTQQELIEARERINSEYYNSKEYKKMVEKKLKLHPELKPCYEEFFDFLKEYKVLQT